MLPDSSYRTAGSMKPAVLMVCSPSGTTDIELLTDSTQTNLSMTGRLMVQIPSDTWRSLCESDVRTIVLSLSWSDSKGWLRRLCASVGKMKSMSSQEGRAAAPVSVEEAG